MDGLIKKSKHGIGRGLETNDFPNDLRRTLKLHATPGHARSPKPLAR